MTLFKGFEQAVPVSEKPDKRIYALQAEGRAVSVLHLPDRRSLEAVMRQRERLLMDTRGCSKLNLPRNPEVRAQGKGFLLIEEMALCAADGAQEYWTADLLKALCQLHEAGWVHLDLKPEHVLYGDGCWQLHDFDGAMPMGVKFRERDITWAYAPPDVLWHNRAEASDDLYAAALMFYRRRNGGRLPFERGNETRAAIRRYLSPVLPVPEAWGGEAKRFFQKALAWNRGRRFHSTDAFVDAFQQVELMWTGEK